MTRSGVFACVVICGVFADCRSGLPSPSGVPVFAEGKGQHDLHPTGPDVRWGRRSLPAPV